jgi:hypothetical protein
VGVGSDDVWVPQDARVFCLLVETPEGDVVNADLVPEGWKPP